MGDFLSSYDNSINQIMITILTDFDLVRFRKNFPKKFAESTLSYLNDILDVASSIQKKSQRDKLTVDDINETLEILGMGKVYGYNYQKNFDFDSIPCQIPGQGVGSLLVPVDPMLDIDEIIYENPPPCPEERFFDFHWLSVNGSMPHIPENDYDSKVGSETPVMPEEINWNIEGEKKMGKRKNSVPPQQQKFFVDIVKEFLNGDDDSIFKELMENKNVLPFVPFFLKFIEDFIAFSMYNSKQMMRSLNFTQALFCNDSFSKNDYCQHFITIAQTLCITPMKYEGEFKFQVRNEAAIFLSQMINHYTEAFPYLKEKMVNNLVNTLMTDNIYQIYGATVALFHLSPLIFQKVMIPKLKNNLEKLKQKIVFTQANDKEDILELISLYIQLTKESHAEINISKQPQNVIDMYNEILSFTLL